MLNVSSALASAGLRVDTQSVSQGQLQVLFEGQGPQCAMLKQYLVTSGRVGLVSSDHLKGAAVHITCQEGITPKGVVPEGQYLDVRVHSPHVPSWPGLARRFIGTDAHDTVQEDLVRAAARAIKHTLGMDDFLQDGCLVVTTQPRRPGKTGSTIWVADPVTGAVTPWYTSTTVLCCPEWVVDPRGHVLVASQHIADAVRLVALRPGRKLLRLLEGPGTLTSLMPVNGLEKVWFCQSGQIWQVDGMAPKGKHRTRITTGQGVYDRPCVQADGSWVAIKDGAVIAVDTTGGERTLVRSSGCSGLSWLPHTPWGVYARSQDGRQAVWRVHPQGATDCWWSDPRVDVKDPRISPDGSLVAALVCRGDHVRLAVREVLSQHTWYIDVPDDARITGVCWAWREGLLDKKC